MITDKDRAELKELTNQIRKSNQTMQWFDYGWDDCAEIITRYVEKKNAESAKQARKESAERVRKEFGAQEGGSNTIDRVCAAILGDSVIKENLTTDHIPDSEKLAIAVKALEEIQAFDTGTWDKPIPFSELWRQARNISDNALKEIQG